jgi:hypothetical protein
MAPRYGGAVTEKPGTTIGARRLGVMLGCLALVILLMSLAYARLPAAALAINDVLLAAALVLAAVGVLVWLFMVGLRTVPHAQRPLMWSVSLLLVLLTAIILLFSYVYLSLQVQTPGSVPGIETHLDAVYFTVTMLATVGFGDITPASQVARSVATFQMLLNLLLIGAIVRVGVSVGKQAAEQRLRSGTLPLPEAAARQVQWKTGEDDAGREARP